MAKKSKKNDTPKKPEPAKPRNKAAESSSKFGWIAALALLSIVGVVAWFIINGSDEI